MISQSPEDRQFYEARMKFLHDEEARLIAARPEGEAKGREEGREAGVAKGRVVGKIQMLQEILGELVANESDLLELELDELSQQLSAQAIAFLKVQILKKAEYDRLKIVRRPGQNAERQGTLRRDGHRIRRVPNHLGRRGPAIG